LELIKELLEPTTQRELLVLTVALAHGKTWETWIKVSRHIVVALVILELVALHNIAVWRKEK
jgi:hypothetical protein